MDCDIFCSSVSLTSSWEKSSKIGFPTVSSCYLPIAFKRARLADKTKRILKTTKKKPVRNQTKF
jgi:hypothetical protein